MSAEGTAICWECKHCESTGPEWHENICTTAPPPITRNMVTGEMNPQERVFCKFRNMYGNCGLFEAKELTND